MKEIKAIIQPFLLHRVLDALREIDGLPGATISESRSVALDGTSFDQVVKTKLEIMVPDDKVEPVLQAIQTHAHTGKVGDGRIFVIAIEQTVKIRTGERDEESLQRP